MIATSAAALAQAPPPDPAAPSLRIEHAALRQDGDDLRLALRFSRAIPVEMIAPARSRFVCLVLGAHTLRQRRLCVSRKDGRLNAKLAPIDARGRIAGRLRVVRRARIAVDDDRLTLRAPASALGVRLGRRVSWRAAITWFDGAPCERVPGPARCSQLAPASGTATLATRRTRPAFASAGHLRVLATGDSMIQIVDGILARRLRPRSGASVRSDARISTGISKAFQLDWVRRAREQARSLRPDVTAISIGANDGFPMTTASGASVACCGGGWVAEYSRRVEAMMRAYRRGGRSYVYWMTLPAPRPQSFARVFRAVNAAIRRAARRAGDGVRVIDLVAVFTPGGRFRSRVTFRGRTVDARQGDGIHLSTAGASIAATLLIDRLRADHALPRRR
jgi:lysophospholipase L1-like esterase